MGCIPLKIRQDKRAINKAVYLALGVSRGGYEDLLGIGVSEDEDVEL
ncbi:MAG: putative transposase [Psychromonas sp.]